MGSGLVNAKKVKLAAGISFLVAAIAGLVLAIVTSLFLILIGCLAILAAWFYTGGSKPYGYSGFGEISVFVFFGLVATVGSRTFKARPSNRFLSYVACRRSFASALLVVNNLEILKLTQRRQQTFAVRLGKAKTQTFFALLLLDLWGCMS